MILRSRGTVKVVLYERACAGSPGRVSATGETSYIKENSASLFYYLVTVARKEARLALDGGYRPCDDSNVSWWRISSVSLASGPIS